jgi:hypothetical protein
MAGANMKESSRVAYDALIFGWAVKVPGTHHHDTTTTITATTTTSTTTTRRVSLRQSSTSLRICCRCLQNPFCAPFHPPSFQAQTICAKQPCV